MKQDISQNNMGIIFVNKLILEIGNSYLKIYSVLSIGVVQFMIYEKLLQVTGKTTLWTVAQIVGAVSNMMFRSNINF